MGTMEEKFFSAAGESKPASIPPPVISKTQAPAAAFGSQDSEEYHLSWKLAFYLGGILPFLTGLFLTVGLYHYASSNAYNRETGRGYIRGSILAPFLTLIIALCVFIVISIYAAQSRREIDAEIEKALSAAREETARRLQLAPATSHETQRPSQRFTPAEAPIERRIEPERQAVDPELLQKNKDAALALLHTRAKKNQEQHDEAQQQLKDARSELLQHEQKLKSAQARAKSASAAADDAREDLQRERNLVVRAKAKAQAIASQPVDSSRGEIIRNANLGKAQAEVARFERDIHSAQEKIVQKNAAAGEAFRAEKECATARDQVAADVERLANRCGALANSAAVIAREIENFEAKPLESFTRPPSPSLNLEGFRQRHKVTDENNPFE